jgi:hypothetical protein
MATTHLPNFTPPSSKPFPWRRQVNDQHNKETEDILVKNILPDNYENAIIAYTQFNSKIVLGGSIALNMLTLMDLDYKERLPDIDFALTECFTVEEFSSIIDFFNLKPRNYNNYRDNSKYELPDINNVLKEELLLYNKYELNSEFINELTNETKERLVHKVDFFNRDYLKERDIINVIYQTKDGSKCPLKLVHPSIIISYKAKYAFDTRVGNQFKHWEDIETLYHRKNADNYFKTMKKITYITQKKSRLKQEVDLF